MAETTRCLSTQSIQLLSDLGTSYERGLSSKSSMDRRFDAESENRVDPPIDCPMWVCCLLPCISKLPSMKAFREILPEDAEVRRDGTWICYDASSLVVGDVVRLREGDVVPADCAILTLGPDSIGEGERGQGKVEDMEVDLSMVNGERKPRTVSSGSDGTVDEAHVFYGSRVLQGCGIAVATAVGRKTLLASLIRAGKWPPKVTKSNECNNKGLALLPYKK